MKGDRAHSALILLIPVCFLLAVGICIDFTYIWFSLQHKKRLFRVNFKKKRLFSIEKLNAFQDTFSVFIKIFGVKAWCMKANIFVKVNSNWIFSLGFLGHLFYLFEQL